MRTTFMAFCAAFFPRSILPGVGGPVVMSLWLCPRKCFYQRKALCQKLEERKKEVFIVQKTSSNFYY